MNWDKSHGIQVGVTVVVLAIVAILYANKVGDNARSGLFRGFVSEMKQVGCELQGVDYDLRTIDVMNFGKSDLSADQIGQRLREFKAYKAKSLIVPLKWTSHEIDVLREKTADMVMSIRKDN